MESATKRHSILIVDDEPSILKALRRALRDEDYTVHTAGNYKETLELVSINTYSVIITDFSMPGICGDDLLGFIRVKCPRCIRLMLSGAAEARPVPGSIANSILNCQKFIAKPWDDEQLRRIIKQCLKDYEAAGKSSAST